MKLIWRFSFLFRYEVWIAQCFLSFVLIILCYPLISMQDFYDSHTTISYQSQVDKSPSTSTSQGNIQVRWRACLQTVLIYYTLRYGSLTISLRSLQSHRGDTIHCCDPHAGILRLSLKSLLSKEWVFTWQESLKLHPMSLSHHYLLVLLPQMVSLPIQLSAFPKGLNYATWDRRRRTNGLCFKGEKGSVKS